MKYFKRALPFLLLTIISVAALQPLFKNGYFSMHDTQHIVRLYLLEKGLSQGSLYPRWVDGLGFGFGYPLFNFYPPLIYYVSVFFQLLGFSLINSIKVMLGIGFLLGMYGMYMFSRTFLGKGASLVAATMYTYFGYHALLIYVRGAFAEFFALSLLPYLFLSLSLLAKRTSSVRMHALAAFALALVILCHPLIAFPTMLYVLLFSLFLIFRSSEKLKVSQRLITSMLLGLVLSSFYWLPSQFERKFTMVDSILTKELADYTIHFVYPKQFWYSPWGFGGSIEGPFDGVSFQLGKVYIGLVMLSALLAGMYWTIKKTRHTNLLQNLWSRLSQKTTRLNTSTTQNASLANYFFVSGMLLVSLFMTTTLSRPIWDRVQYLWYLQFPWRFLTFATIFVALTGSYAIEFLEQILARTHTPANLKRLLLAFTTTAAIVVILFVQSKYFAPQEQLQVRDKQLTSEEEIVWKISRSSFEFIPKDVATTFSDRDTTIPKINRDMAYHEDIEILSGKSDVRVLKDTFSEKRYALDVTEPTIFRLNRFHFPGWHATLDKKILQIQDDNPLKLMTVRVPSGQHELTFTFRNTPIRTFGNYLSIAGFLIAALLLSGRRISDLVAGK